MIEAGDLYWADLGFGRHPILVVSREELNRGNKVVAVVLSTRRLAIRNFPNVVLFNAGDFGLPKDCVAQAESVGPVLFHEIAEKIGKVSDDVLRDVIRAVGYVMQADCEPT